MLKKTQLKIHYLAFIQKTAFLSNCLVQFQYNLDRLTTTAYKSQAKLKRSLKIRFNQ